MTVIKTDSVTEYRINRLEEIVEKLAENQLTLTRIESMGIENQRSIEKLYDTVAEQQKVTKTLELKMNTAESKIDSVTWITRLVGTSIVLAILGAILAEIGLRT